VRLERISKELHVHRQPPSRSILVAALLLATSATIADASPRRGKASRSPAPFSATTQDSSIQRSVSVNGFTQGTQLPDGSFELLNGSWTEFDENGCDSWIGNWNSPLPFFPKAPDGTNTFWSGGCCGACETTNDAHGGSVEQTITVPAQNPYLIFWVLIERDDLPGDAASDVAYVNFDGSSVWSVDVSTNANDTSLGGGVYCFVPVRVDLSSKVGQTKLLEAGMTPPTDEVIANVVFDDFRWADLIFADAFECGGPEFWSETHN